MEDKIKINDKTEWFAKELILAILHNQFNRKHCKFQGKDDTGQVVSDPQKVWDWIESKLKVIPMDAKVKVNFADFKKAVSLLRDLADLQNGSPLVAYEKEWRKTMDDIYTFLNEHESKIQPNSVAAKKIAGL